MRKLTRAMLASLSLAGLALGASAQSTTAPGQQPAAVGVSPQTAVEANQKAVPRSDTGTVVRTGKTAGDRAHNAASSASAAMSGSGSSGSGSAGSGSGSGTNSSDTTASSMRNDRNNSNSTSMRTARNDRH